MTTAERNRRNAQASTGPVTPEGKAASSQNALRHGLTAHRWPILPDEADAYALHRAALLAEAAPAGPIETALSEHIALLLWRLRRCASLESGLLAWHLAQGEHAQASAERAEAAPDVFASIRERDTIIRNQAAHDDAEARERDAQARQRRGWPALGHGFAQDAAAFLTLSRYELGIEAALWRALSQLRQLQAARYETKPASEDESFRSLNISPEAEGAEPLSRDNESEPPVSYDGTVT